MTGNGWEVGETTHILVGDNVGHLLQQELSSLVAFVDG